MSVRVCSSGGKPRFRETTASPADDEVWAAHAETPRCPPARAGSLLRAPLGPNQPLPSSEGARVPEPRRSRAQHPAPVLGGAQEVSVHLSMEKGTFLIRWKFLWDGKNISELNFLQLGEVWEGIWGTRRIFPVLFRSPAWVPALTLKHERCRVRLKASPSWKTRLPQADSLPGLLFFFKQ